MMRYLIFFIVLFSSPLYAQDLVSPLPETLEVQETSANVTTVDEKQTYETLEVQEASANVTTVDEKQTYETLEVQEASAEVTTVDEKHTVVAYTCTHKSKDLIREVKIIYQDQGCEVTYTKAVGTVNEKKNFNKNMDGFVLIR
jgi:hydroxylamine reductase (hybrid-cluster protein)